jgi:hypothetical protein
VWCLIIFSLSILWPFAEGRGHSHQNDRFPSYEVVVCWLVLNVAQSPMPNSTHTRLRMLACGFLLLPTEFLEKPLILLHPWQTLSFTIFCVHTRRGFTSSISHHSLLTIPSTVYLGFNFFVMKSCQTFIPEKHPSPPTFFHSWHFGSMFVFILS